VELYFYPTHTPTQILSRSGQEQFYVILLVNTGTMVLGEVREVKTSLYIKGVCGE
jgi:hypothetical protein